MTEEGGGSQPQSLPAPPAAEAGGFVATTLQGGQTFSLEQSEHQLRAEDPAHRRVLELEDHRLALEDRRKDNDLRRYCFGGVLRLLVIVLFFSGLQGVTNQDPTTKQRAQGLVTTLIGGLLGAIAGYFTAKAGS